MKFLGKKPASAGAATSATGAAKATTRQRGNVGEDRALAYLQAQGLQLLERNYRTPGRGGGEIDLIMRARDGTVVFVEVRSRGRSSAAYGGAGSSIGAVKQQRLVYAARHYLLRYASPPPCRFDAVLLEDSVEWIQAAFDAQ
jgi:putative endonuclease